MKNLNKTATEVFKKLIAGLEYGGKSHRKIENGAYMPLSVEIIDSFQNGSFMVSICQYGEMNGDLMRDPEMTFFVSKSAIDIYVYPAYFRNDYMAFERTSLVIEKDCTRINRALQAEHTRFANTWMKNIKDQGFLEKLQTMLAIG